jgi:hypothetical protein
MAVKKGKHIGFQKLQKQIEGKGYSKESAGNITYSIGVKKYGKEGFDKLRKKAKKGK